MAKMAKMTKVPVPEQQALCFPLPCFNPCKGFPSLPRYRCRVCGHAANCAASNPKPPEISC